MIGLAGLTGFHAKVMNLITCIAREYQPTSDRIMVGLVNMLDSTCSSLANEAAVAVSGKTIVTWRSPEF